ncbi:MAG: hypothetical protein IPP58_02735 [Holophagaceae bacterium]|uniref:FeoB-associated Cys-rich membrane protein n=1 Tax=Candidatus Geothrix skivensis TaxID=2954439 RepID=A0A9D7XKB6_9BACT|nr:hypothetical protein [Candidatus Geothrix skivensis]
MSFQTLFVASAVGLSALYFIRGALQDFGVGTRPAQGGSCGKCSSGGCPVGRKG